MATSLAEPDTDTSPDTSADDRDTHWVCCKEPPTETLCNLPVTPEDSARPDQDVTCPVCLMLDELEIPCGPDCTYRKVRA